MNSTDKRIEELLNRAGQTISDLPKASGYLYAHPVNNPEVFGNVMKAVCEFNGMDRNEYYRTDFKAVKVLVDYVMHLTDIIDRLETALENLLNLKDRHVHIVSNVDAPEGLTQEQYFTAAEAIIDATDKYRAGLEPWDDWSADDD